MNKSQGIMVTKASVLPSASKYFSVMYKTEVLEFSSESDVLYTIFCSYFH